MIYEDITLCILKKEENFNIKKYIDNTVFYRYNIYLQELEKGIYKIIKNRLGTFK